MLIGFAGSSGSGKTTLINSIAEKINCGVRSAIGGGSFFTEPFMLKLFLLAVLILFFPT
ncbi:MAG: hypothetical protein J7K36_02785 [Archaeoglobaceae archaeon]|nr:hypothetical protein [Archaeoglobaceae archaeon]